MKDAVQELVDKLYIRLQSDPKLTEYMLKNGCDKLPCNRCPLRGDDHPCAIIVNTLDLGSHVSDIKTVVKYILENSVDAKFSQEIEEVIKQHIGET